MRLATNLIVLGMLLAIGGCGSKPTASDSPPPKANTPGGPISLSGPAPSAPAKPAENPAPPANPAPAAPNPVPAANPMPAANPSPMPEGKVAGVGVGKKGRYSRENVLGTIIATRWRVEEKLLFEAQIPQAMQVYKAMNPSGKGPKSHEEFMQKILKDNSLKLPELPAGERYEYDPATEQLMVVSGEKE